MDALWLLEKIFSQINITKGTDSDLSIKSVLVPDVELRLLCDVVSPMNFLLALEDEELLKSHLFYK